MNLLTRAVVSKLISDNAKTEFSCGKLSVSPSFNGTCTVRFPIMFTPYKTVGVEAVAKKFGPETGYAAIGIELKRNGAFFCRDARMGKFLLDGDNYRQYNLRFFIPFGVNEAYITLECERGATVSVLSLSSQTDGYTGAADAEVKYIADGGMSAYAPKNTMHTDVKAARVSPSSSRAYSPSVLTPWPMRQMVPPTKKAFRQSVSSGLLSLRSAMSAW